MNLLSKNLTNTIEKERNHESKINSINES